MNSDITTIELKTKLTEALAEYLSAINYSPQQPILDLGVSIYRNEDAKKDEKLLQSAGLINFLDKQIKNGNDDIITEDVVKEIFAYILQKLTTGIVYKYL